MTEQNKNTERGAYPALWRSPIVTLPGGFKPAGGNATAADNGDLPDGAILRAGTPIRVDFGAKEAKLCKSAQIKSVDSTNKKFTVPQGNYFVVGDKVIYDGAADTVSSAKITAIEVSGTDEVITVSAALGATADTRKILLLASNPIPNAIIAADCKYDKGGINCVDAASEATLLIGGVKWEAPTSWLNGYTFKEAPGINLIKQ